MKRFMLLASCIGFSVGYAQNKIPSKESQINTALIAAPEMYKDGAKVLGYNSSGEIVT